MLTSDVLTGHKGVETAGVEVSVSSNNSLFLELISQGSNHPLEPISRAITEPRMYNAKVRLLKKHLWNMRKSSCSQNND